MDPHFNEYLAAIVGMRDVYGERPENHPTEFHGDEPAIASGASAAATAAL